MGKIGLIFDTESGNTNRAAVMIERQFPKGTVEVWSAAQLDASLLSRYRALIVGTPSMSRGNTADNWQFFLESDGLDFTGKTIALFGLADQVNYPDAFADGLGVLYRRLVELGATVVGAWPTAGYDFTKSGAVVDGQFVGLVLDQDNQSALTKGRIERWVESIQQALLGVAG